MMKINHQNISHNVNNLIYGWAMSKYLPTSQFKING